MKLTSPKIISELREKLQFDIGRHLYGVLGTYAQLAQFETENLAKALDPFGKPFPAAVNLSRDLLARIPDSGLQTLIAGEARYPQAVQRGLNKELGRFLHTYLQNHPLLIIKRIELLYAYDLDFSLFRTHASNQNHILLLLPGERRSNHVTIFHEATKEFHRSLPLNLIADNHLWEL